MTNERHIGSLRIEQCGAENKRYASLFKHMSSVDCRGFLFPRGSLGRLAYKWANRQILFPYGYHRLVRYLTRRYQGFLATEPIHAVYSECPVVVDADDPDFSEGYMNCLNHAQVRAVVTTTDLLRDELMRRGLRKDCVVIPSGVDLAGVKPRKVASHGSRIVAGFATPRLYLREEVDLTSFGSGLGEVSFLLEVMNEVWRHCDTIELQLIGQPSRRLRDRVRDEPRIKLLGLVPHEEILDCYSQWDIALYPRLVDVGGRHSIKLVEYMAAGCAIVSTKVTEAFLVEEAKAAEIVGNAEEFADAMVALASSWKRREELSGRGKAFAQAYDWAKLAKRYEQDVLNVYLR